MNFLEEVYQENVLDVSSPLKDLTWFQYRSLKGVSKQINKSDSMD